MIYLSTLFLLTLTLLFLLKKKKRKASKNNFSIKTPTHWHSILEENVLFYKKLSPKDQLHFKKRVYTFLQEITIEAIDFELEELDTLLVAASAIIPVFAFDNWHYSNIKTIVIYPDYFNHNLQFHSKAKNKTIGGLVGTGRFENQMILSRRALHHGFSNKTDKGNTGIHEFVHLIDKLDGKVDGIPKVLLENENILLWLDIIHDKMEKINNNKSDIRNYGGTSKIEFFAVASEYFFERPLLLKHKHPELFKMLSECFNTAKP